MRLLNEETGTSVIEFALLAPLVLILFGELANFATRMLATHEVEAAAEAGAHYASDNGFAVNGMSNAIQSYSAGLTISANPAPQLVCACPGQGISLSIVTCSATCLGGGSPASYALSSASMTYSDSFQMFSDGSTAIKATSWTRIK